MLPFLQRALRTFVVLVGGLGAGTMAHAWGVDGHRLVGERAAEQLSPAARTQVQNLLQLEAGSTLGSIANWADETRSRATSAWHYVNLPRDASCQYDPQRDCPQGQCVVAAIEQQTQILRTARDPEQRLKALKYLVNFVADIHQPLHAAFEDDRGGNTAQLQAFGRGTNLHALWDSGLIAHWPGGTAALSAELDQTRPRSKASDDVRSDRRNARNPAQWAEESCRIASAEGFYPNQRRLPADYVERAQPLVRLRLQLAAQRLAELLNNALTETAPKEAK